MLGRPVMASFMSHFVNGSTVSKAEMDAHVPKQAQGQLGDDISLQVFW
jgi:hypothetical protein